jgi:hypothetical protein
MCWQHTKLEKGLEIKESSIPNAGKGLFATRNLPANTSIKYARDQDFFNRNLLPEDDRNAYLLCGRGDYCADGASTQSGLARWVNDPRGSGHRQNARLTLSRNNGRNHASVKLTRNINAGAEIFAPYGQGYWRNRVKRAAPKAAPKAAKRARRN